MAKKALCVGINDYPGTNSDLRGCVNDANDWAAVLSNRGFAVEQLLDRAATKAAMHAAFQKIVREAETGDSVVITYSGHGSYVADADGDEADERDEILCPYDIAMSRNAAFTDDELYDVFADRARGVKIVFISDSCHSGTVTRFAPIVDEIEVTSLKRFLPPENFLSADDMGETAAAARNRSFGAPRPFGGVLISGCQDTQTSADARIGGRWCGAFSYFALKTLPTLPPAATYRDWHAEILKFLPNQVYSQKPNFGGTRTQKRWRVLQ